MPALPNTTTQKLPEPPKRHPDPADPAPVPPPRGSQESKHNRHNDPPAAKAHVCGEKRMIADRAQAQKSPAPAGLFLR
jgi:hypothetical protein